MARTTSRADSANTPRDLDGLSYESAMAELEQLVVAMESGQMPLDRLLEGYKRGAELLALCRLRLKKVEEQVQVLENGHLRPLEAGPG